MKKNILVLFGGKSVEHDISVITAMQTINNLNKDKYTTYPVYIDKQGKWFFCEKFCDIKSIINFSYKDKSIKQALLVAGDNNLYITNKNKLKKLATIDCVLFATHGGLGENGAIQGVIEASNIAYTSPKVLSSAICMDKSISKRLFEKAGLNVCDWVSVYSQNISNNINETIKEITSKLSYPMVVKPCNLGSSIGISYVSTKKQLVSALKLASDFDDVVLVEKAVDNLEEVNVSVFELDGKTILSQPEKPITTKNLLDFNEKYLSGTNSKSGMASIKREYPAKLPQQVLSTIMDMSTAAYKTCKCSGVVRIDFLLDAISKKVYINEINTIPGSLSFYLWQDKYTFSELLDNMINQAIIDKTTQQKKNVVYNTNVLQNFAINNNGAKMHK